MIRILMVMVMVMVIRGNIGRAIHIHMLIRGNMDMGVPMGILTPTATITINIVRITECHSRDVR